MPVSDNRSTHSYRTHTHADLCMSLSVSTQLTTEHHKQLNTRGDHRTTDMVVYTLIRHIGKTTMGFFIAPMHNSQTRIHTHGMVIKDGISAMMPSLIWGEKFSALDNNEKKKKKRNETDAFLWWQRLLSV